MAFVLKGYPRLSETFIAQEIAALEQLGLQILIISLRHPTDKHTHPIHAEIRAPLLYLPEYLRDEPAPGAACLVACPAPAGVSRRLAGMDARSVARPHSQSWTAIRPGAGAGP